jgi:two-component system cell cycle sensor histidine kinase/response regulator CckA
VAEPQSESTPPVIVLIAEDEEPVRRMVARILWTEGYRTLEARDGAEALHLARLSLPHLDLVITDVVMPTMDGRELGRQLAQDCAGLPVLYISAYLKGDVFHRDGLDPSSFFLQKPFSDEDLLQKVKGLLATPRRRDNSASAI